MPKIGSHLQIRIFRERAPNFDTPQDVRLLSPEDVASRCGLSRKAVYRAIDRGELKSARLCSRLRIRPDDVEAWVEGNSVARVRNVQSLTPPALSAPNGLRSLVEERHGAEGK